MKKTILDFKDKILKLPLKDKYTKEDLLIEDFLIDEKGNIKVYYAPHNEYINKKAKVIIVGITPGFNQMNNAFVEARYDLNENLDLEEIKYRCKEKGRFSGPLRKNTITMLDIISLNKALNIDSCSELFLDKDYLIHTTALVSYPVFIKDKNYTGHTPSLIKSEFLMKYVYDIFIEEIKTIEEFDKAIIIPLGKAVLEVLIKLSEEGYIKEEQILKGFPHPSGANVNRVNELNKNKDDMTKFILNKFK